MSTVVKEVITEGIDYWSPPLKKHRYSMNSVERRVFESNGTPSGLLMEYIQERDRALSGVLDVEDAPQQAAQVMPEDVQQFSSFLDEALSSDDAPPEETDGKSKRKFRALKRIEKLIYDDSAVKQGELEDEAFELLNQDGFYDEVLPIDYTEDNKPTRKIPVKSLILYSGIILLLIGIIFVWLRIFIF